MANSIGDKYKITRGKSESARLENQHRLYNEALGYAIHPIIANRLLSSSSGGEPTQIAELATGTTIWLRDLRTSLSTNPSFHPESQFCGFDISDAQYPPPASRPANLHLYKHNATQPFPLEFQGRFDLIHIRLLVLGLDRDDWAAVAVQALTLLKPGGFIQWDEGDFSGTDMVARSSDTPPQTPQSSLERLGAKGVASLGEAMCQWRNLPSALSNAGFEGVLHDRVMCDRKPEMRQAFTLLAVEAYRNILSQCQKMGIVKDWTGADVESAYEEAMIEAKSGILYFVWSINVFVARRAL